VEKGKGTESPVKCHNQWNTSCQAEGVSDRLLGMMWLTAVIMKPFFTPPNHFEGGREEGRGAGTLGWGVEMEKAENMEEGQAGKAKKKKRAC